MKYICKLCNKDFKQKSNYTVHINRKRPCINIKYKISDIPISDINNLLDNLQDTHNNTQTSLYTTQIPLYTTQKSENIIDKLTCVLCNIKFSRKDALTRHINNYCKQNKIIEENKKLIEDNLKLKEQNEFLSKQIVKTKTKTSIKNQINNNIIQNIQTQNNITINFGDEDMSKLTEDEILTSLKSLSNCFNNFVKIVHLNERLPQYSNILINNMRSDYASIVEDGHFVSKNKYKIIENLISMRVEDIESLIIDYRHKLTSKELSFIKNIVEFLKNAYIETEDVDGYI